MAHTQTLVILLAAGSAAAGPRVQPELASSGTMKSRPVAHIYYNLATDEKVATLWSGLRPSDDGISQAVWISDNSMPCADHGQLSEYVLVVDTVHCMTCFSSSCDSPRLRRIFMDWGDIPADQVIDCVGVSWSTQIEDVDTDGDGVGDGVEGFGARWIWSDSYTGFSTSSQFLIATEITLANLPGAFMPLGDFEMATYTATIDLMSDGRNDVFELGDTDLVDGSGSGRYNPGSGADLDGDGLADFGYGIQFIQPGTRDIDGDGIIDGDFSDAADSGWVLATPPGTTVQNDDGSWSLIPDPLPAGRGAEDAYEVWSDCNGTKPHIIPFGTFWFGGFSCDRNGDGVGGDGRAFVQTYVRMYGPSVGNVCPADLFPAPDGDGVLNFFDVNRFIGLFLGQDPAADLFPDGGDGRFNTFDISTFLTQFVAGCP